MNGTTPKSLICQICISAMICLFLIYHGELFSESILHDNHGEVNMELYHNDKNSSNNWFRKLA